MKYIQLFEKRRNDAVQKRVEKDHLIEKFKRLREENKKCTVEILECAKELLMILPKQDPCEDSIFYPCAKLARFICENMNKKSEDGVVLAECASTFWNDANSLHLVEPTFERALNAVHEAKSKLFVHWKRAEIDFEQGNYETCVNRLDEFQMVKTGHQQQPHPKILIGFTHHLPLIAVEVLKLKIRALMMLGKMREAHQHTCFIVENSIVDFQIQTLLSEIKSWL